jgi:hypothetical protein
MNEGIERIKQVSRSTNGNILGMSGPGAWRFTESEKRWPAADAIYRNVFAALGMPLADGDIVKLVDKGDYRASFDGEFGVDIIIRTARGHRLTLQEKLLSYHKQTVTVEYMQDWRNQVRGDWFTLACQYYFVGYHDKNERTLHSWILLNWPEVRRLSEQMRIQWKEGRNKEDGARSSFLFEDFQKFPPSCVLAVKYRNQPPTIYPERHQMPQLVIETVATNNTDVIFR